MIYKDIIGYEGLYQISSVGYVKSLNRIAKSRSSNHWYTKAERILKHEVTKFGYARVQLVKDGVITRHLVHRLVAIAFIPNSDNKLEVNHIDGNKLNNHVSNLEWVTPSENRIHAINTGLRNPRLAKTYIPEDIRSNIKNEYIKGSKDYGCIALSRKYGIGKQSVLNIVNEI